MRATWSIYLLLTTYYLLLARHLVDLRQVAVLLPEGVGVVQRLFRQVLRHVLPESRHLP